MTGSIYKSLERPLYLPRSESLIAAVTIGRGSLPSLERRVGSGQQEAEKKVNDNAKAIEHLLNVLSGKENGVNKNVNSGALGVFFSDTHSWSRWLHRENLRQPVARETMGENLGTVPFV
ncbi:uncharacterized protein N7473_003427 [Penicillium subrubescens]|uniref:uncharacterized protein n=1 Tax=Penicillium subrubescens TaxID=1316194 RepID=UPI002544DCA5|nr:uncharacterized protein N7473_003427 [Penicillium subrubescens]KAJ5906511.1 hypothetical protein N7473_003427 [Penicillium subrubescens]